MLGGCVQQCVELGITRCLGFLFAAAVYLVPTIYSRGELPNRTTVDRIRRHPYCSAGPVDVGEFEPSVAVLSAAGAGSFPTWSSGGPNIAVCRMVRAVGMLTK